MVCTVSICKTLDEKEYFVRCNIDIVSLESLETLFMHICLSQEVGYVYVLIRQVPGASTVIQSRSLSRMFFLNRTFGFLFLDA